MKQSLLPDNNKLPTPALYDHDYSSSLALDHLLASTNDHSYSRPTISADEVMRISTLTNKDHDYARPFPSVVNTNDHNYIKRSTKKRVP